MDSENIVKRRPGRLVGPKTDRYQVLLTPELAEWGKQQPGGLSGLLRRLLEEARDEPLPEGSLRAKEGMVRVAIGPRRLLGMTIPRALGPIAEAVSASRSILELKDDWDGEGGAGYSEAVWQRAGRFLLKNAVHLWQQNHRVLPPPAIYPGPDGSIDILWESENATLLINMPPGGDEPAKWYGSLTDGSETTKGAMTATETNLRLLAWMTELIPAA